MANYDKARGRALLTMMERIRAFERQAELAATRDRLVLGAIHLSIGQEAIPAGIMPHLRREDLILSTHRGHGHTLAKGAHPDAMMKELLGRQGGNDFEIPTAGLNLLLHRLLAAEAPLVARRSLPLGSSLLAVASP